MSAMIPANIDHVAIIADLNRRGLKDFKIETICGFSVGYVAHLRKSVKQMTYQRAARLYNFWLSEADVSREPLPIHVVVDSSTRIDS
jgi:hypothetical protein